MAAENLENTGKKLGIALKAETDGSGGAQNVLTREEIAAADAIIIAADKNVEMARFDGKPVIMVPVAEMCIRDSYGTYNGKIAIVRLSFCLLS